MKLLTLLFVVALATMTSLAAEKNPEATATAALKRHVANLASVERRADDIQVGWTDVKYEMKRQNLTTQPFVATLAAVRYTGKDANSGLKVNYIATLVYEDSRWVLSKLLAAFPDVDSSPPEPVPAGSTGWKILIQAMKLRTD